MRSLSYRARDRSTREVSPRVFQKRKYDEKVRIWKKKRKKIKRYLHLHSRISFANNVVSSQRCFCNRKKNKRELIPRETSKLEFGEPRFHLFLSLSVKKKGRITLDPKSFNEHQRVTRLLRSNFFHPISIRFPLRGTPVYEFFTVP